MVAWLLVVHIFGLTLWISGLLVTTAALSQHAQERSNEVRQTLGRIRKVALRGMADTGALLTIVAGIFLILSNRAYFLHARWLHIKLTFVLLLIGLHGLIGTRSKALTAGRITAQPKYWRLLFLAILLVFLSILIATLPGSVYLT
jgi:putative membrane protein